MIEDFANTAAQINYAHILSFVPHNPLADRLCLYGPQDLFNACVTPDRRKLKAAQAIASEVRTRRPEMQVRRIA